MSQIKNKRIFFSAIVVIALLTLVFGQAVIFHLFPAFAFSQLTGRSILSDVRVTAYASDRSDNLFRRAHYWRLEHGPEGFASLQKGAEFKIYSDNVAGYISAVRNTLAPDLRDQEISQVWQWNRDRQRSQFILRHQQNLISYYVLSTR
jgi:hypothetical protein